MNLTSHQIAWITQQIAIDEEEDFEAYTSLAEYVGCFINGEAATAARESRLASKDNAGRIESTDFEEMIKDQFGRELDTNAPPVLSTNEAASRRRPIGGGVSPKELQQVEVLRRKRDFVPQE